MRRDRAPQTLRGGTLAGGARQAGQITPYVNENAARADKIMSMEQLAADTGGKAFFNTNDLNGAMQRAIADGSHYYRLVIRRLTRKWMDVSQHQDKPADCKYKLSYRHGYNADDLPHTETKARSEPSATAVGRGMPSSTQVLYGVRVLPVDPQPAPTSPRAGKNSKLTGPVKRYSVDFMIRWIDIKLDTGRQGKHTGKIQVECWPRSRGQGVDWAGGTKHELAPELFCADSESGVPAHFEIDVPSRQGCLSLDRSVRLEDGQGWNPGIRFPAGAGKSGVDTSQKTQRTPE